MKAFIFAAAMLAGSAAYADGFGYQGDDGSYSGFGYQAPPDWSFPSGQYDYVAPCCAYPETPGTFGDDY